MKLLRTVSKLPVIGVCALLGVSIIAPAWAQYDVDLDQIAAPFKGMLPRSSEIEGWPGFPVIGPTEGLPWELPGRTTVTQVRARAYYRDGPDGPIEHISVNYHVEQKAVWRASETGQWQPVWGTSFSISVREHQTQESMQHFRPAGVAPDRVVRLGDFACWRDIPHSRDEEGLHVERGMFTVNVTFSLDRGMMAEATREPMRELTLFWAEKIVGRLGQPPQEPAGLEITAGPLGDPNPVEPGGRVRCSVQARHPANLPLSYRWTATGGSFDDPTAASPIWTAPAGAGGPTEYGISVGVSAADGAMVGASYLQQIGAAPDLTVKSDWIVLTFPRNNAFMEIERDADRQCVAVQLKNTHPTATARDVLVRVSAGPRGQDGTHIGAPIVVGEVGPGETKVVSTMWDLQGANVEDYRLYAHAYCLNMDDANPDDNYAWIDIDGIYYAHNGTRAFSFANDTFSFNNFGMDGRGITGLIENHAALLASGLDRSAPRRPLVDDPFHMLMYMRYEKYIQAFSKAGQGGNCHGFVHSVSDYFMDPAKRPGGREVSSLSMPEAAMTIHTYQTTQMLRLGPSMLLDRRYASHDWGVAETLEGAQNALRGSRRPIEIGFSGYEEKGDGTNLGGWGHAVLGFKLVRVAGREPILYVYDPNLPFSSPGVQNGRCMTQVRFAGTNFDMSPSMNAIYHQTAYSSGRRSRMWADGIAAVPWLRELDHSAVTATTSAAKASIYAMSRWMEQSGMAGHVLRCPADAHFIDAQGRRTGLVNGQQVNEIPGAEIRVADEVEIYFLPVDRQYQVVIEGTGQGQARFASVRGVADTAIGVTAFAEIPLRPGGRITGTVLPGGEIASLSADGAVIAPRLNDVLTANDPVWGGSEGQKLTVTSPADGASVPERFTVSGTCAAGRRVYVTAIAEAQLKETGQAATSPIVEGKEATVSANGTWSIEVNARPVYRDARVELQRVRITVEAHAGGAVVEQVGLIVRP